MNHDQGFPYVTFKLNFFVDDIKLEEGKRDDRISNQIFEEVMAYLKQTDVLGDQLPPTLIPPSDFPTVPATESFDASSLEKIG